MKQCDCLNICFISSFFSSECMTFAPMVNANIKHKSNPNPNPNPNPNLNPYPNLNQKPNHYPHSKAPVQLYEFKQEVCRTWSLNTSSWLLEQLLGTSWRFLIDAGRPRSSRICSKILWLFDMSCHFLTTSWAFLTVSQPLLDDFLMIKKQHEIVKNASERFQKAVKNFRHNRCNITNPPLCVYTRGQDR